MMKQTQTYKLTHRGTALAVAKYSKRSKSWTFASPTGNDGGAVIASEVYDSGNPQIETLWAEYKKAVQAALGVTVKRGRPRLSEPKPKKTTKAVGELAKLAEQPAAPAFAAAREKERELEPA